MKSDDIKTIIAPFADRPLLVGLSGGADSLGLLLRLKPAAADLVAVHFEHGLRGPAGEADAEYCRKFCAAHGIPFRLIALDVPARRRAGESVEAAARRCRLEAWQELQTEYPGSAVALGHQADDRRENLLLRLARGANASGLSSLRPVTRLGKLVILRPLLHVPRRDIEAFLLAHGVSDWRCDRTNADAAYRRNFIRGELFPALFRSMPFAATGFDRALDALEEDARLLEELAACEVKKIAGRPVTAARFWRALPPALQIRVLRGYLGSVTGHDYIPGHALLRRFRALLAAPSSPETRQLPLGAGAVWRLQSDEFRLKPARIFDAAVWKWQSEDELVCGGFRFAATRIADGGKSGRFEAVFAAAALPEELLIAPARPGDRMIPFGRRRPETLKKLRTDRKISRRDAPPVVKTPDGEIIWAPGVRHAEFGRIADPGQPMVKLICRPEAD
jgi:tRNA(Ile)-lysidine synthase